MGYCMAGYFFECYEVVAVTKKYEKKKGNKKNRKGDKGLLFGDSDHELTDYHAGANGALAQIININQDARKSVRMENDKAYLSGRLWCADLIEISLSATLDCKASLMMLLPMLWLILYLEISMSGAVSTTQQRADAVEH